MYYDFGLKRIIFGNNTIYYGKILYRKDRCDFWGDSGWKFFKLNIEKERMELWNIN